MTPPDDPATGRPPIVWRSEHSESAVTIRTDLHGARHMTTSTGHVRIVDAHRMAAVRLARSNDLADCAVCLVIDDSGGVHKPAHVHVLGTTNSRSFLKDHDAGSPDWSRVLIASRMHGAWGRQETQDVATDIADRAMKAGRFLVSGSPSPSPRQTLSTRQAAEMHDIAILTATAKLPLLSPPTQRESIQAPILHLRDLPDTTQATVSPRGILIHAGTLIENVDPSGTHMVEIGFRHLALLQMGAIRGTGYQLEFVRDHLLEDPSSAAALIRGRPTNGWGAWQDASGTPLRALI